MFSSIAFYIGERVLGLNGREYPLGELTAEVLNISPEEYHELQQMLDRAMDSVGHYEEEHRMQDWFDANEEMIRLHDALCRHRIFRTIQEEEEILSEARTLTEQYSIFTEENLELGEGTERSWLQSKYMKTTWNTRRTMAGKTTSSINLAMRIIPRLFPERRSLQNHRKRQGHCWLTMGR